MKLKTKYEREYWKNYQSQRKSTLIAMTIMALVLIVELWVLLNTESTSLLIFVSIVIGWCLAHIVVYLFQLSKHKLDYHIRCSHEALRDRYMAVAEEAIEENQKLRRLNAKKKIKKKKIR